MKIALILSGQVRCFEKCSDSQKKFLIDDLNADVFCHFWDTADLKPNIRSVVSKERIPDYIHLKDDNNLKNKLLSLYKPKKYIIEPQVKFNNTRFSFRMISMYYSMQKAYLLCREYGFYDCIIRCRTDLFFQKPFLIEWLNNLHYVYCLEFGNGYCQDTFAFGPMKYMDIYSILIIIFVMVFLKVMIVVVNAF